MGFWGAEIEWKISSKLAEPPEREVSLEGLESLAIAQRLDLAALREETQSLAYAASLVSSTRWLPGIDIGAEIGRLTTGRVAIGPSVSIELPIFDQQRAVLARLEALTRQTEHKTAATA